VYTDGTSTRFLEGFSDWFTPQNFPGEIDAVVMPDRNFADGSQDQRPFSLCAYVSRLNSSKTVRSITVPNNPDVLVLAATCSATNARLGAVNQRAVDLGLDLS
jgi:hypothetical protein